MINESELIPQAMAKLFTNAHTFRKFSTQPVKSQLLRDIWDSVKLGPTAFNACPARITVISNQTARQKLLPAMAASNQTATQQAPLSLILSVDPNYPNLIRRFDPDNRATQLLENNPQLAEQTAHTSAWLQAGYLIMALRLHGLQVGPMTGANMANIDQEFHTQTGWQSFLVLNVGYPEGETPTRGGRPTYTDVFLEV